MNLRRALYAAFLANQDDLVSFLGNGAEQQFLHQLRADACWVASEKCNGGQGHEGSKFFVICNYGLQYIETRRMHNIR